MRHTTTQVTDWICADASELTQTSTVYRPADGLQYRSGDMFGATPRPMPDE